MTENKIPESAAPWTADPPDQGGGGTDKGQKELGRGKPPEEKKEE